jgi:hypothetical protein
MEGGGYWVNVIKTFVIAFHSKRMFISALSAVTRFEHWLILTENWLRELYVVNWMSNRVNFRIFDKWGIVNFWQLLKITYISSPHFWTTLFHSYVRLCINFDKKGFGAFFHKVIWEVFFSLGANSWVGANFTPRHQLLHSRVRKFAGRQLFCRRKKTV